MPSNLITPLFEAVSSGSTARKRTIAYFSGSPGSALNFEKWQTWKGVAEAARENQANLIYVAGEEFERSPQAILYDFIGQHNVDGIILWDAFFSPRTELERIQTFVDHYWPLPVVCIEQVLEGCSNLLFDNAQGIRDLLGHLVQVHGYRKIAFLSQIGNHSALTRRQAFESCMKEFGLFDAGLVGSLEELDARGIQPGEDYQVIVSHSDYDAVDLVEKMTLRGLRIPDDLAVTGFNDGREARGSLPPLTTVRLPFRRVGRRAVEVLLERMDGKNHPEREVFPLQLLLRRSCGCLEPLAEQAAIGSIPCNEEKLSTALSIHQGEIVRLMARSLGTTQESLGLGWSKRIFENFSSEFRQMGNAEPCQASANYLQNLYILLREAVDEGVNVSRWHDAISVMRQFVIPCLRNSDLAFAEDLFQQARVMVGQAAVRSEVHRNLQASKRSDVLREIEAALLISFDFTELFDLLTQSLGRLSIRHFYLVQYEGIARPDGQARLLLAYEEGSRIEIPADCQLFSVRDLLPEGYRKLGEPFGWIIEALHLREEQIGYIIFRTDPPSDSLECEIYQALRIQLSSAIKGVRLRERLYDALRQAEEANQLKSRFLSMVSHELRTPLNLIVGLSEMAIRHQDRSGKQSVDILKKYHEQIYISGQHLDRLIRDVLDLASSQVGQMRLTLHPVDLVPVLRDAASMGEQLAGQKNLVFRTEIPDQLPKISGDKTRIRQVLLNLLSNAVKFTAHGEVVFSAGLAPGGILISVRDTGLGIPENEQERIFDEFQQSDRSAGRGYGGIGLGLAITRRLVEMHGGKIWVTSPALNEIGSIFNLIIPALPPDEGEKEALAPGKRSTRVLIWTEEDQNSRLLAAHLSRQGFEVEETALADQEHFLDYLQKNPPGAIVLDLAPASEQGWEIMRRLKENPATHEIPVLFYSLVADQEMGSVVEMDYLAKPIGVDQLVNALKRHGLKGDKTNHPKILIVDDDAGVLELHSRTVQMQLPGCRIMTAADGLRALDCMRSFRPDLVLLDLMMPELDGFGVLKSMQEDPVLGSIPVIILSGQVLTRREMLRLNQGVASVLSKGIFSKEEIFTRIENVLMRSQRMGGEGQRLVFLAMAYIHEHYRNPISRADIAGNLNVNEQYLSRCFNKELGIGPMNYLSRYRIEQAKKLLSVGNMSITQVALEVGLSSQSYFSRIFQQETGITPSSYQRGIRKPAD